MCARRWVASATSRRSRASRRVGWVGKEAVTQDRADEMLDKRTQSWRQWRESSRQRQIDRALYKAGGGGLPSRQATRGNAYVGDVRQAERSADAAGQSSDSADDA